MSEKRREARGPNGESVATTSQRNRSDSLRQSSCSRARELYNHDRVLLQPRYHNLISNYRTLALVHEFPKSDFPKPNPVGAPFLLTALAPLEGRIRERLLV